MNLDEVSAADLWDRVVAAAGEVQAQADMSRVVLFLARMDGARVLVVGTDEPLGPSKGSPECAVGEELAADGRLVYAANMTAAASDAALRGLGKWAATARVTRGRGDACGRLASAAAPQQIRTSPTLRTRTTDRRGA
ncbi:hypothetical protein ACWY4P_47440 [Streptomyces sp. LZ34]